jgi:hypothetical protein
MRDTSSFRALDQPTRVEVRWVNTAGGRRHPTEGVLMFARITTALLLAALITPAAAEEAYFSMGRLQSASRLFVQVSEVSQRNNERIQREVVTTGGALDGLGDALAAARVRTGSPPTALAERHQQLTAAFEADWTGLNQFVDQLVLDTDKAFIGALATHVEAIEDAEGITLGTCEPAGGVLGMAMGQSACEGRDLTDALVGALDGDDALAAAVADIVGREWPAIRPARQAVVPLMMASGELLAEPTPGWSPMRVYERGAVCADLEAAVDEAWRMASRELQRAQEDLEVNRRMFASEIDALDEAELEARQTELDAELATIKAASERLTAWRADTVAGALALLWELAADREAAAMGALGEESLGICLQPADLGGCTGPDVTNGMGDYLASEKKVTKAIERYVASLEAPDLDL